MIAIDPEFKAAAHAGRALFLASGAGAARIEVYGTVRAASTADAPGGAALVVLELDDPVPASVVGSTLVLHCSVDPMIDNTGAAVWARVFNADGDVCFDCDVSLPGGDGEVQITNGAGSLSLYAGGLVSLTSAVLN